MTSQDLRQKFLDFFKEKKHAIIDGASLIPENDPTVLFTTAGMHPLVPYLMGEKHAEGTRLVNIQKCIRTGDIDEVGDAYHHTFFEMLGNWSLGDYFKEESLTWSLEFLTDKKWLGLDKNLISVSVFKSDSDAYNIWQNLGFSKKKIAKLPKKENWWGPAGKTGPCGPDSEIFYQIGDSKVEIWNNVFMQFNKTAAGKYKSLSQKNIDTGMGLERTLAIINGLDDNYKTDLFINIIKKIEELSGVKYGEAEKTTRAMRIIADHIKAATFIMGDNKGVAPSNLDQGYVVRRLIRRAIRYGKQLGVDVSQKLWTKEIAQVVIDDFKNAYPELEKNKKFIINNIDEEEAKFSKTLKRGLREIKKIRDSFVHGISSNEFDAKKAFYIYQTLGFPLEMIQEELKKSHLFVDEKKFQEEFKKHQELSRTANAGKFKSGLADHGEETTKLHTAAHLLLAALRQVLGDHIFQRGSNITPERLRLDFSHSEKLTDQQKEKIEKIINEAIEKKLPITCEEMPVDKAKKQGAMGIFDSKYGKKVKVYTVGDCQIKKDSFSCEICAGPHVKDTGKLGHFKIIKEQSSSSGVRRIKAVLE